MSREGKFAKNVLIISIGTFLPKFASFITLPILTGCLTKAEYGTLDLISVLVSLMLPTVTLQIQTAAFRFLIDVRENEEEIKKIITNIFAFICPTSLLALVIMFFALFSQPVSIRISMCLFFLVDILVNAARQICRGLDMNMHYSLSATISAAGKIVFAVLMVYILKTGLFGTIISLIAASLISLIYILIKTKIHRYIDFGCFDKDKLKEMLHYSWPMVPNSMSGWVMRVSDRFVVTGFMGIAANAVYAVANKIPSLLTLAQTTFTLAWQENASIVSRDEDASEYYSSMFRTIFDIMAGFFGLLIAATPLLFKLLIRGSYDEAYYQIPILFVAILFYTLSTYLGGIYVAYMRSKSVGITTTIAAAINLVTDIGLIKFIGLYAASGSTLISYVFLFIYRAIDVQKIVKVRINLKHFFGVMLFVFLEAVLCYMQIMVLNIINVIFGLAVFFIINRDFINAVRRKINKKLRHKR